LDTDGNEFGGFTPVEWESRVPKRISRGRAVHLNYSNCCKGDDSMRSFLFTLRNPHGVPPRKFALREEKKGKAISCESDWGPRFYSGIGVSDNCNTNRDSYTLIGTRWNDRSYVNDTRFEYFLTGDYRFTVKEIEIFEIT
jgi:hypothetical protein